jgi:hypothetical protein
LNIEKSMFTVPGARTFGSVRPALPNVNGAGCENTEALRYPLSLAATDPLKAALCPLLFGRNTHAITSGVYSLPFGRGQQFGAHWNRAVDAVLGGWQLNGVSTEQTGFPLSPTTQNTSNAGGNGVLSYDISKFGDVVVTKRRLKAGGSNVGTSADAARKSAYATRDSCPQP